MPNLFYLLFSSFIICPHLPPLSYENKHTVLVLFFFERLHNSSHFQYFTHVLIYFLFGLWNYYLQIYFSIFACNLGGLYVKGTQWEILVQTKFTHFIGSGFPGKPTLGQKCACSKVIGVCSREQCLWEYKWARIEQWEKLICKTTAAKTLEDYIVLNNYDDPLQIYLT